MTPEDFNKLAGMGWIKPDTAMQLAQSMNSGGAAPPAPTPPSGPLVSVQPPLPPQMSQMPVGGPPPSIGTPPPGGWPAGQGLSHSTPNVPGMTVPGSPGYVPPPASFEALASRINSGEAAKHSTVSADLKAPTTPPSVGIDSPPVTVSAPQVHRGGVPLPPAQSHPTMGPVGGGVPHVKTPAKPSAADDYIGGLRDLQSRQDERGERLMSAIEDGQAAEREKSTALAAGKLEAAASAQRALDESTARLAASRAEADGADKESRERASALAAKRVDPNGYWNNKSTGEKILGSLALALGAFGSALSKTPNFAFQMMENAIERDIGAQRENIASAKDSAAMIDKISREKYGRALTGFELEARQRLDSYNFALQKVEAAAAKYDDPIAKAKAEQYKLQIMDSIDKTKQNISTNIFEVKTAQEAAEARKRAAMYAGAVAGHKEQKEQIKAYRDLVQKNMENGDGLQVAQARALAVMGGPGSFRGELPALSGKPDGGPGALPGDPLRIVPKAQQSEALKEQMSVSNTEKSIENVEKLFNQWREGSSGVVPSITGSQRKVVQASVKTTVKRGAGPGMSSDSDREQFIDPLVPALGDSDETLERKKQQIIDGLRGSSPSPILDRYSPGWRKLSEGEATQAGEAQFGFKRGK